MSITTGQNEANRGNGSVAAAASEALQESENKPDPAAEINKLSNLPEPIVKNFEYNIKFRKPRKDKDGNEPVDADGVPIPTRPPASFVLPVLTQPGMIAWLQKDQKHIDFVLDLLQDQVIAAANEQIYEGKMVQRQEDLDLNLLTMDYIATLSKDERTGRGIPKDTWEEFVKDYVEVMVPVTSRTAEKVTNAAKTLAAKLSPVRSQKKVVAFLRDQLDMWAANTPNLDDFKAVYMYLTKKADDYLKMDEESTLANLQ